MSTPKKNRRSNSILSEISILDLPDEVLGIVFTYIDCKTRSLLWKVHTKFNRVMEEWCPQTLNLRNVYLCDKVPPLSIIRDTKKRFSWIIFENVRLDASAIDFLFRICRRADKITIINDTGFRNDALIFKILTKCNTDEEKSKKQKLEMFDDSLKLLTPNEKEILNGFDVLSATLYGVRFFRYNKMRLTNNIEYTISDWNQYGHVFSLEYRKDYEDFRGFWSENAFFQRHSESSKFGRSHLFVELHSRHMMHQMQLAYIGWNQLIAISKDMDLKNVNYFCLNDGDHNIREFLKYHKNIEVSL